MQSADYHETCAEFGNVASLVHNQCSGKIFIIYCHKNINDYNTNNFYHHYHTRDGDLLRPDHHRLERSKLSVNYYCPKLYNKLPRHFKTLNENAFKNTVKQLLLNGAFFSIQEYLDVDF